MSLFELKVSLMTVYYKPTAKQLTVFFIGGGAGTDNVSSHRR